VIDNIIKISKETSAENIRSKIKSLQTERSKTEKLYSNEVDPEVKQIRYEKLQKLDQEIADLTIELNGIQEQTKKKAKQSLDSVIDNNTIAYISSDDKYILIRNYSKTDTKVNLVETILSKTELPGVLNILSKNSGQFDELSAVDIRQCFERCGKSYVIRTSSFNDDKWREDEVYNVINEQRKYWAPINTGTDYDPLFDDLIYSLAGGKQENIDYIEKWVAYKYLYPEKCKTIPNLSITGRPGGNGKGMFITLLKSIFTENGVGLIRSKNLTGGFNAVMEGKVITVLDDEKKSNFPQDELKQNSGNPNVMIERKGIDSYTVDATANTIVLDNTGLVKLVGGGIGGEDRRWSVMSTELKLLDHLQEKYTITDDQSRKAAEEMATTLFENRISSGKWVAHCIEKWDVTNMMVLPPLHGIDYLDRIAEQKDNWTTIFEQVLPIMINQGFMPMKFLKQIVEASTEERIKNAGPMTKKFDEFLSRKGHKNIEKVEQAYYKISMGPRGLVEKDKGAIRRIDPTANTFDFRLISNEPWSKKTSITKDSLELRDFSVETADLDVADSLFAKTQINPVYPVYEDEDE
jgi:hypothetical protein